MKIPLRRPWEGYITHEPMFLFIYGGEMRPKKCADVIVRTKVLQTQTIRDIKCRRCCEHAPNVFLNSAGEEKPNGQSVFLKRTTHYANEISNHLSIITLVESINDDHHRERQGQRTHRFNDQLSKLPFV